MRKIKIFLVVTLSVFFFTSCLTSKQKNLLRDPGGSIPSYPQAEAIGEYTIKPGDELSVQITVPTEESKTARVFRLFSTQNMTSTVGKLSTLAVTPTGTIYFPYIGDIYVVGKTTLEIQTEIEKTLNQELFVGEESCIVYVRLANRFFSVIGESRSGNYPIAKEQLTIYQALSQSGDAAAYGDRSKVKIIRQTEGGTEIRTFDLRSSDIVNSEYYYVQPNDVIYIQPLGRQFLGLNSFGTIFSIISTVASLGITTYQLVKKM